MYHILLFMCISLYAADLKCMEKADVPAVSPVIMPDDSASINSLAAPLLPPSPTVSLAQTVPTVPDVEYEQTLEVRVLPQQQDEDREVEWRCGPCCVCRERVFLAGTFVAMWGVFATFMYLVKKYGHS